ncbi:MAG: MBL fold metallo-hydrolase [Clostridiales bacterium]|nr:MBL fold metallo-hydrolase [Clostridiales bacterium]
MKIYMIPLGPVQSNMYLAEAQDAFFIVDPSCPSDAVTGEVRERFLAQGPSAVFITHAHFDHMYFMEQWKEEYPDTPLYMSAKDAKLLKDPDHNCSSLTFRGRSFEDVTSDIMAVDGKFIAGDSRSGVKTTIYSTPGHTSGSCSILLEEYSGDKVTDRALFTGDALFCGSVGRCDFETGSESEMRQSVAFFASLPKDLRVYPGHGPSTDIGSEIRHNPFF